MSGNADPEREKDFIEELRKLLMEHDAHVDHLGAEQRWEWFMDKWAWFKKHTLDVNASKGKIEDLEILFTIILPQGETEDKANWMWLRDFHRDVYDKLYIARYGSPKSPPSAPTSTAPAPLIPAEVKVARLLRLIPAAPGEVEDFKEMRSIIKASRTEAIAKLDGKCFEPTCDITDETMLEIDHLYDDGAVHRKMPTGRGPAFYADVVEHGRRYYQLLCGSHHNKKTAEARERAKREAGK